MDQPTKASKNSILDHPDLVDSTRKLGHQNMARWGGVLQAETTSIPDNTYASAGHTYDINLLLFFEPQPCTCHVKSHNAPHAAAPVPGLPARSNLPRRTYGAVRNRE